MDTTSSTTAASPVGHIAGSPTASLPSISDVLTRFRSVVPTKEEVIGAISGAVPDGAAVSPEARRQQAVVAERRSKGSGRGPLAHPVVALVAFTTASAAATYAAFVLYRNWSANFANLTIMETVHLPAETSDSFVELSIPLEGEIRLACSLLSRCKFVLRLNASLKPTVTGSPHSRSRSRRLNTVSNASILSGGDASSHASYSSRSGGGKVVVQGVEMNEVCDAWQSEETGRLHFAPASTSDGTVLMRYKGESNDNFQSPLCIKQCWVQPASAPNAHRLSFELFVHGPCMDVAVTIIFPKGAQLLSVDTQGAGHWQNAGAFAPNEIVWHVGSYTNERTGVDAAVKAVGGLLGAAGGNKNINHAGNVQYDSVQQGATTAGGSEVEGSPAAPVVLSGELPLASIRFQAVYTVNAIHQSEGELKTNRKERRRQEREQKKDDKRANRHTSSAEMERLRQEVHDAENFPGNAVEFDPVVNVPAVCVAFSTNSSTSGLAVKQLKTTEETLHYDMLTDVFGGADYWSRDSLYRRGESARQRITRRTVVNTVAAYGFLRGLAGRMVRKIKGEAEPFLPHEHEDQPDAQELTRRRQQVAEAAVRRYEGGSAAHTMDRGNFAHSDEREDRLASTMPNMRPGANELFGDPEEHMSSTSRGPISLSAHNPYSHQDQQPSSSSYGAQDIVRPREALAGASSPTANAHDAEMPLPPTKTKISKRVRYITNFIQQIRVVPNY